MTYYPPVKPEGSFALKNGDYGRLGLTTVTPKAAGIVFHLLYLNVDYVLTNRAFAGELRVRLVRHAFGNQPVDPTAYQEYPLVPTPSGKGNLLITYTYFETTEKGRPVHWEARVTGANGAVTTRYRKGWQP